MKKKQTKNAPIIRKNRNFENRATSCSNQAQMTPWAKISWSKDFWWLRKTWTDRQTNRHDSFFISINVSYTILCRYTKAWSLVKVNVSLSLRSVICHNMWHLLPRWCHMSLWCDINFLNDVHLKLVQSSPDPN